ncbi:MAG: sigma 54-interacting transcriptional regulator [Desulfomonilaceae bacterium]
MAKIDELRKRAEESLESGGVELDDISGLSSNDLGRLVHQLRVHQVELEMQNEELRRAQFEMETAQAKYSELYEFAPVGYFTLDKRGVIRQANLAGAQLVAANAKSFLVDSPFSKFVHPDDLRTFLLHLRQIYQNGERLTCEIRLKKNGEEVFVRLDSAPAKNIDGEVTDCLTVVTDLTARKKAEQALAHSEQRFRTVCESTEEIIIIKDMSRKCIYVNPAAERLFGIPASQMIGRRFESLVQDADPDQCKELDRRVIEGEVIEEQQRRTLNGVTLTFLETRTPVRNKSGQINGILFHAREITDRKLSLSTLEPGEPAYTSAAMQAVLKMAAVAAQRNVTILLLGESGSGKDYVAKYIHDHSPRSGGPYFSINCAALPPELAESELFGHERGSFTGAAGRKRGLLELAEGGTLLLNEIGELSLPLQAKLLTFLDTKKFPRVGGEKQVSVNARLIAATNKDLHREVEEGRFRKDLLYRLDVMRIEVPPLRQRIDDIPVLVREIMGRLKADLQLPQVPAIDSAKIKSLQSYHWPGNVRELRNVLERGLILAGRGGIRLSGLPGEESSADWSFSTEFPTDRSLNDITHDLKRSLVVEALRRTRGKRQAAARLLGISRDSLKHYLKTLDIKDEFDIEDE